MATDPGSRLNGMNYCTLGLRWQARHISFELLLSKIRSLKYFGLGVILLQRFNLGLQIKTIQISFLRLGVAMLMVVVENFKLEIGEQLNLDLARQQLLIGRSHLRTIVIGK